MRKCYQDTIRLLFERLRFDHSLEVIIFNTRKLANFLLEMKPLSSKLKPNFESDEVKRAILSKSFSELGMNKSTLWYQKRRLEQNGNLDYTTRPNIISYD